MATGNARVFLLISMDRMHDRLASRGYYGSYRERRHLKEAYQLSRPKKLCLLAVSLILLAACAEYRKCGYDGCPGDAQITTAVQSLLASHADLGPPNLIHVQTIDGIVYLSGEVNTDLVRQTAESVARGAAGIKRIVNSIAVTYGGH
jgi:BON domain